MIKDMTIDEIIEHCNRTVEFESKYIVKGRRGGGKVEYSKRYLEHKLVAEWLEELKELRAYKEKMEIQYLDDISNPLEPLKLKSALESEIFKYNYRKEHKPKDISPLDYTIMHALKHCLEEQIGERAK